jgi:hypothetical protein
MCSLPRWLRWDPTDGKAGDAISDEEAIEAARQAQQAQREALEAQQLVRAEEVRRWGVWLF